jgi:hypothetical protein
MPPPAHTPPFGPPHAERLLWRAGLAALLDADFPIRAAALTEPGSYDTHAARHGLLQGGCDPDDLHRPRLMGSVALDDRSRQ